MFEFSISCQNRTSESFRLHLRVKKPILRQSIIVLNYSSALLSVFLDCEILLSQILLNVAKFNQFVSYDDLLTGSGILINYPQLTNPNVW